MAIIKSPYICNPSIMAHPDYKVLDVRMDLTGVDCILAGSPINAEGKVANDATCVGILLHDVHACLGAERTGQVVIDGLVDQEEALKHCGIQISAAAKSALVNVSFTGDSVRMGGGGASSWNDLQDKPFGDVETVILPETELTFADMDGMWASMPTFTADPVANTNCTVTFNGAVYECSVIDNGEDGVAFGNVGILGDDDTGEPFVVIHQPGELTMMLLSSSDITTATVSIKGVKPVPIESKYSPGIYELDLTALGVGIIKQDSATEGTVPGEVTTALNTAVKQGVVLVKAEFEFDYMALATGGIGHFGPSVETFSAFIHDRGGACFDIFGIFQDNIIAIEIFGMDLRAKIHRLALATT